MDQKKSKNPSPRIKVIQKIYNFLMNPNSEISFPKNQYKKFIKDVVNGTLERSELIEETVKLPIGFIVGTSFITGSIIGNFFNIGLDNKK